MKRKKQLSGPEWIIWESEYFPRELHSDSVVFYINEHADIDDDEIARRSLAKQILQEGLSDSLGEAFKFIQDSRVFLAGYRYEEYDESTLPIYCDSDDPDLDYDATFVEVPYVG